VLDIAADNYIFSLVLRFSVGFLVHLHECSPFWVGIFIIFPKKTPFMFTVDVDMRILIGKALKHFCML